MRTEKYLSHLSESLKPKWVENEMKFHLKFSDEILAFKNSARFDIFHNHKSNIPASSERYSNWEVSSISENIWNTEGGIRKKILAYFWIFFFCGPTKKMHF